LCHEKKSVFELEFGEEIFWDFQNGKYFLENSKRFWKIKIGAENKKIENDVL